MNIDYIVSLNCESIVNRYLNDYHSLNYQQVRFICSKPIPRWFKNEIVCLETGIYEIDNIKCKRNVILIYFSTCMYKVIDQYIVSSRENYQI